jgi:hypothetical protein
MPVDRQASRCRIPKPEPWSELWRNYAFHMHRGPYPSQARAESSGFPALVHRPGFGQACTVVTLYFVRGLGALFVLLGPAAVGRAHQASSGGRG